MCRGNQSKWCGVWFLEGVLFWGLKAKDGKCLFERVPHLFDGWRESEFRKFIS